MSVSEACEAEADGGRIRHHMRGSAKHIGAHGHFLMTFMGPTRFALYEELCDRLTEAQAGCLRRDGETSRAAPPRAAPAADEEPGGHIVQTR